MSDLRQAFREAVAALAADPAFGSHVGPGAALALWDPWGRLVWTSPEVSAIERALVVHPDGTLDPSVPALPRLKALARGGAPRTGIRLERLRFDPSRLALPSTCACRIVSIPSGEEALLTAFVGGAPKLTTLRRPASAAPVAPAALAPEPAAPTQITETAPPVAPAPPLEPEAAPEAEPPRTDATAHESPPVEATASPETVPSAETPPPTDALVRVEAYPEPQPEFASTEGDEAPVTPAVFLDDAPPPLEVEFATPDVSPEAAPAGDLPEAVAEPEGSFAALEGAEPEHPGQGEAERATPQQALPEPVASGQAEAPAAESAPEASQPVAPSETTDAKADELSTRETAPLSGGAQPASPAAADEAGPAGEVWADEIEGAACRAEASETAPPEPEEATVAGAEPQGAADAVEPASDPVQGVRFEDEPAAPELQGEAAAQETSHGAPTVESAEPAAFEGERPEPLPAADDEPRLAVPEASDPSNEAEAPAGAEVARGGSAEHHAAQIEAAEHELAQAAPPQAAPVASKQAADPEPQPEPPLATEEPASLASVPVAAPEPAADPLARLRGRGTVRFVWQADPQTRFTAISEALGSVVGLESAAVIGQTWDEACQGPVSDPLGIIDELLARRETWSGRTVLWRIAGTDLAVEVDLAGMPALGRDRELLGFRGFGLCRTDRIVPFHRRPPDPPLPPLPDLGPENRRDDEPVASEPEPGEASTDPDAIPGEASDGPAPAAELSPLPGEPRESERPVGDAVPLSALATEPEPGVLAAGLGDGAPSHPEHPAGDLPDAAILALEAAPEEAAPIEPETPPGPSETEAAQEPPAEPPSAPSEETYVPRPPSPTARELRAARREARRAQGSLLSGAVHAFLGEPPRVPLREVDLVDEVMFEVESFERPDPQARQEPEGAEASREEPAPVEPEGEAARSAPGPEPIQPDARAGLSDSERNAFREIALALGAPPNASEPQPDGAGAWLVGERILHALPLGVLVHRGDAPLFANQALLRLAGFDSVEALHAEGGLPRLLRGRAAPPREDEEGTPTVLATRRNEPVPVEVRLASVDWDGGPAGVMLVRRLPDSDPAQRLRALELDLRSREGRLRELSSILDTATDGVIVLDDSGRILSLNRSAEALFGYDQNEVTGDALTVLLAPESHVIALDYLDGLRANGVASLLNDGREVMGRVRQGGAIPLFMTMGRVSDGPDRKFCAVLRDITAFKKAEAELLQAKRAAEESSAQKSDFLAKVSHEVRTPLNAIIGFAEVMLEERFGPVGNERYRDYLRDIHSSGGHVISLVNDLLDLAKIEAGRMELAFTGVSLNELVQSCVTLMQPQAARDRIVVRTSFAQKLPPVVADERSIRQIALNLVSNAIKFTDAGGQVIVSTALTDRGEVAFRVRDTGIGMNPGEVEAALEPFRQLNTARKSDGTGLGLPLTKALIEANRGSLHITSAKDEGTLVEVLFPPTRVLAE